MSMDIKELLTEIHGLARAALEDANDMKHLEELRVKYLGKKGELTAILKQMGLLSADERPVVGALANEIRAEIDELVTRRLSQLKTREQAGRIEHETIDVTMPGKKQRAGGRHPLSIALEEAKEIFLGMGFTSVSGPEVEYDYYCFEALNMPRSHPARDTQDTFYITDDIILRTHTSSVQVRAMETQKPPLRIISPGRVYRVDEVDATHSPLFNQIEGLVVDKGVTFGDLKGTLATFARMLYGEGVKVRFRPHHFPYTEPSAEMDTMCHACEGKGCRICKFEGWIELLGCGMVHPAVLEGCGIDSSVYTGFAFGMGVERMTMRRFGIDDLRLFYENDLRFLSQF
jgi:phenylalanyl-tRNA synthetase alpha chain